MTLREPRLEVPLPVTRFLHDSNMEFDMTRNAYIKIEGIAVKAPGAWATSWCDVPGHPATWIVTVQLGVIEGEGGLPLFQSYWIDANANILAHYPKNIGGNRIVSFEVQAGRTIVMFASGGDPNSLKAASFWTVEAKPAKWYELTP